LAFVPKTIRVHAKNYLSLLMLWHGKVL